MKSTLQAAKILKLPKATIHKIAAGEVIESPASVIKELVENSIDAGSTEISIYTNEAGLELIRVEDNGSGIGAGDLDLAVTEHATSKIADIADLKDVLSYGFRGEALASIASVSSFTIASRTHQSEVGTKNHYQAGEKKSGETIALSPGTRIWVENLFFNTPVRRKFLKSARAENTAIRGVVVRLALANPNIHFRYFRDGAGNLDLPPAAESGERIRQIFGNEWIEGMLPVELEHQGYRLTGFVSTADFYRSHRRDQYTFINGRSIVIPGLGKVFRDAYGDLLPHGSFPVGFLYFEIAPTELDVNVHPTKKEIRFVDEDRLFGFLAVALKRALENQDAIRFMNAKKRYGRKPFSGKFRDGNFFKKTDDKNQTGFDFPAVSQEAVDNSATGDYRYSSFVDGLAEVGEFKAELESEAGESERPAPEVETAEETAEVPPVKESAHKFRRHFGIIFDTYILAEGGGKFYIVDQHAAHERIRYEAVLGELGEGEVAVQNLLTPLTEAVTAGEAELIAEYLPLLQKAGLDVDFVGESQIILQSVPFYVGDGQELYLLRDMLGRVEKLEAKFGKPPLAEPAPETASADDVSMEPYYKELAASIACHSAIKQGDVHSGQVITDMLRDLTACSEPNRCPHGRPTIIGLDKAEMEKLFARRY